VAAIIAVLTNSVSLEAFHLGKLLDEFVLSH
jgi:hypothetical protein